MSLSAYNIVQYRHLKSVLRTVLLITKGTRSYKHCPNFGSFELFLIQTWSLYSFTSIANPRSVRYSVYSISYFYTNIAVQNVNKAKRLFTGITEFTASLRLISRKIIKNHYTVLLNILVRPQLKQIIFTGS